MADRCRVCCDCSCLILILGTIAVWIAYLAIRSPSQPEFSIVSTNVSSFNITSFPTQVSANFDLTLSATNPNNLYGLQYSALDATILYGTAAIVQGSFPSFIQGRQNTTTVKTTLAADKNFLLPSIAAGIINDLASHKAVVLNLNVTTKISFKPRRFAWPRTLKMQCKDITIWFAEAATGSTMEEPPKRCDILNKWKF